MLSTDKSVLPLRVWLHEADLSIVHQAVYPLYMELGRWDLAIRSGLGKWMIENRCAGILGAQIIRYQRPIKRLQAFEVHTKLLGWDEKWLYIENELRAKGKTKLVGCVRLMFVNRNHNPIPPREAVIACGGEATSPELGDTPKLLARFADKPE